jgi:pimeloyl-ACP methyl ester carboxylesterase
VPYESLHIPTRYGATHVIASGPKVGQPLILIPGLAVTAAMWEPNIAAFSQEYRCYAIDVIGDYGKSVLDHPRKHPRRGRNYSNWLSDVFDGLGIDRANLIGASNGGYVGINHAIFAPERVRKIVLMAPSGLNITLSQVLPKIFHYLLFPAETNRERLIKWFLGDNPTTHEALYDQMWLATQGIPKVPIPILITGRMLNQVMAPTLFILGENDPVISATIGTRRIQQYLSHAEIVVIPDVGHVINYEAREIVEKYVLKFLLDDE